MSVRLRVALLLAVTACTAHCGKSNPADNADASGASSGSSSGFGTGGSSGDNGSSSGAVFSGSTSSSGSGSGVSEAGDDGGLADGDATVTGEAGEAGGEAGDDGSAETGGSSGTASSSGSSSGSDSGSTSGSSSGSTSSSSSSGGSSSGGADGGPDGAADGAADSAADSAADGAAEGGTDSAADGGADGGGCGMQSTTRGQAVMQTVTVGTTTRTYLMYVPQSASATTPLPFVYVFHGFAMSGQAMYDITQYAALAESQGIALVFPDGEGGANSLTAPWSVENAGQTVCGTGQLENASGDDFSFIDKMRSTVSQYQCIDSAHVYATGFSMGGYFSHHIGCYRSDIRAVGPASGGTINDLSVCTTGHVPVIIFHGTADGLISPSCDDPHMPAAGAATETGFTASATLWAQKNGCQTTYQTVSNKGTSGTMGTGQCYVYDGCPADGQVELCTFNGMSHEWAGGSNSTSAFGDPNYASATQLEWAFFKKYAW